MIIQNVNIQTQQPAWWFIFSHNQLLQIETAPGVPNLPASVLDYASHHLEQVTQIGEYQGHPCYLIDMEAEQPEIKGAEWLSLRHFLMRNDQQLFQIAARAWQVALFLRTHRFCGKCGSRMHRINWELATQCPSCEHRCYPRISPCIIVAIKKGKQILLAQGRHHQNDMYSTLAGFVESGESLEQAVHREVMEEVGVEIENLRYFSSQPWPFPHSLMVGYLADYKARDIEVDGHEIIKADFFNFDDLPHTPPAFSIAGQLIKATIEGH